MCFSFILRKQVEKLRKQLVIILILLVFTEIPSLQISWNIQDWINSAVTSDVGKELGRSRSPVQWELQSGYLPEQQNTSSWPVTYFQISKTTLENSPPSQIFCAEMADTIVRDIVSVQSSEGDEEVDFSLKSLLVHWPVFCVTKSFATLTGIAVSVLKHEVATQLEDQVDDKNE